jgi:hypothetical protein
MKFRAQYLLALVIATISPLLQASEKEAKTPTSLKDAVASIESRISITDRRAVLAHMTNDRLRSERLWPSGGAAEHAKLLSWVEKQWDLSNASKLGRYLEAGGVLVGRRAEFLVYAWFDNYENGKIDEANLFRRNQLLEEFAKELKKNPTRSLLD